MRPAPLRFPWNPAARPVASVILGVLALGVAPFVAPEPAHAVYEVCNPYTLQQFRDQMAAMEKAFETFDLNEARYQAETAEKEARCVDSPMTPEDIGRFAVLRARMYFLDSKTDDAAEWMLVALAAVGNKAVAGIGEEDPLRLVLRDVDMEERGRAKFDGNALPPPGGFVLHNGRLMQQPTGYTGVRGLVQIFDKKSMRVEGFWLFGADYGGSVEKQFVAAGGAPYKAPKTWTGPSMESAPDLTKIVEAVLGGGDVADPGDGTPEPPTDPPKDPPKDVEGGGVADPGSKPTDGGDRKPEKPEKPEKPDKDGGADAGGGGEGPVAGKPDAVKPPKAPKPPGDGPNGPLLSTGLGLVALGGAMYGIGYAISSAPIDYPYDASQLASRRSTANMLVLGSAVAGAAGVGVGIVGLVSQDGAGLGLRGRW